MSLRQRNMPTICAHCGRVEDPEELRPAVLRGVKTLICLRCIAGFWRWMK